MAQVMMDNPLSPSPQAQLKKVVQDLQVLNAAMCRNLLADCVEDLKHEFNSSGLPITDDNQTLHRFCAKLEFLLQTGFKGKTSLFGEKKDYWNYMCDCLSSTKGLRDGIKFVKANTELRTPLGRGRAFVRFALMHQRLADTIQQCVCSEKQTNDWYHPRSVWLQPNLSSTIINNLYDLNDLQFDLSPRGYDLDTTWPTFARKTFGSPHVWAPPSRSTSVSSLASLPTVDVPPSPGPFSSTRQSEEFDQLQHELNESENEKFTLQVKVESLQDRKEMAQTKVNTLEKELADLQKICNENEVRCDKLQNELNLKEAAWAEKERHLKNQVEVAEQTLSELRSQIGASQNSGQEGFNAAELIGKIAVLQKTKAALEIELKTANLELDNKKQVDSGKTKLIELLDKKVEQLNDQNKRMLAQLETAAEERKKDAEGSKTANVLLEETMNRTHRAETINTELQKANEQLRKMLENVEEKGQRIGTLAKEKLGIYKQENSKLLANVQELTRQVISLKATAGPSGEGGQGVDAAVTAAVHSAQSDIQMWRDKYEKMSEECERLKSSQVTTGSQGSDSSSSSQSRVAELEEELEKIRKERNDMDKSLVSVRSEVKNVVLDKLKVEEELKVIEVKQKEARSRHEELLKLMVQKETAANHLQYELSEVKALLQGSDEGQTGIEEPQEGDRGVIRQVKALLRQNASVQRDQRSADARNISLRKDLETKEKKVEEVSADLMKAHLEIADLKTMISQSEVAAADLATKLDKYQGELDTFQNKLAEKEREKETLEDTLKHKEELVCQLSSSLQEEQKQSKEDKAELNEKLQELSSQLELKKKRIVELEDVNQSLEMQMKESRERFEGIMHKQVDQEGHTKDVEDKFKSTKQNLKKVDKENKKLLIERDNMRKTISTMEKDAESLRAQICTMEQSMSDSVEEKLSILQTALSEERKGRQELEVDVAHLRKRHQENEVLVNMMQEKKRTVLKEYEENLQSKQRQIDDLKNEINAVRKEREKFQKIEAESEANQERLKQEIAVIKSDFEKINTEFENQRKKAEDAEARVREVLGELDTVKLGKENLEAAREIIVTEIGHLKVTLEEKEAELEKSNSLISEKTQECEMYEGSIKSLESENAVNVGELERVQQELGDTREQLQSMREVNADLEVRLSMTSEANITATESLSNHQQELTNTLHHMQQEAVDKSAEMASLRQKLQDAEKELEQARSKLVQSEHQQSRPDEFASLQRKLQESEADLTSTQQSLMSLQADMALQEAKFTGVRECLEQELSALRFQLSSEQMQHDEALRGFDADGSSMSDLVSKVTAQEMLIDSMEQELEQLKRDRLVEKSRMWNELEELRQSLGTRDEECKLLNKELKRTSMLLDEERNLALKVKNELVDERARHFEEMRRNREETELLRNDTDVLKQQLIKLIKDKDVLWQKTDKLEYLQKLTLSGSWMEDNNVHSCLGCNAEFSFLLRKHHCRFCGRIFCFNCSNHWVMTPHSSKKERICNDCASMHTYVESERITALTKSELDDEEEDDEGRAEGFVRSEDARPARPGARCTPEGGVSAPHGFTQPAEEDRPPVTFTADEDDLEDSQPQDIPDRTQSQSETGLAGSLPTAILGSVSPAVDVTTVTDDTLEAAVAMPTKHQYTKASTDVGQGSEMTRQRNSGGEEENPDEEVYDVITEEEIVQSMHDSMIETDSSVSCCPLLTVDQIAAGQALKDPDLTVRAGKMYAVPVFIDAPGIVLCWDFSTEPKGIHFSVNYKPGPLTSSDSAEVLIPLCRCNSHKQAVQGELIARKPGVYTLLFDNSTSRITSKKLLYHLHVRKPEAAD